MFRTLFFVLNLVSLNIFFYTAYLPFHASHLCGQIGSPHEIEPATQEILLSHGIYDEDFTDEVYSFLFFSMEKGWS